MVNVENYSKIKKIAVVVPIYNVANYLSECLNSILDQGLEQEDIQVILIDDGSIDNSPKIAQKYVDKYPDIFELHLFTNAGLGAARNRGTRFAKAQYITYVDPDDIVVSGSYKKMIDIIDETGSDIVTGNVHRFNTKKEWSNNIHNKSHLKTSLKSNLKDHPELIWDSTAWNKIYNLNFLKTNKLFFPEGVLYEDIPMTNPAFAAANSIDILEIPVYLWRVRENSITNSSTDAKAFLDRIYITRIAIEGLKKFKASDEALEILYLKSLNMGMIEMLKKEKYELITPQRKKAIFSTLKDFLKEFPSDILQKANFDKLIYFEKVLEVTTQAEFDELTINYLQNNFKIFGYWNETNQYTLKSDLSKLEKIATSEDMQPNQKIESVIFEGDVLKIKGYFYATYSDMSSADQVLVKNVSAIASDDEDNEIVVTDIGKASVFKNTRITAKFGYNLNHMVKDDPDFNYDYSGYEINISLSDLKVKKDSEMTIILEVVIDGQSMDIPIKNPISGAKARPDVLILNNNVYRVSYKSDWQLALSVEDSDVNEINVVNNTFYVNENLNQIALRSGNKIFPLDISDGIVTISKSIQEKLKSFDKSIFHWWKFVTNVGEDESPVYYSGDAIDLSGDANLELLFSNNGVATLAISYIYPIIEKIYVEDDVLRLSFKLTGWMREAINVQVMADPMLSIVWETKKVRDDCYELILPLTLDGFSDKTWLNFNIRLTFADGYQTDEALRWGQKKFDLKNQWVAADNIDWFFRSVDKREHSTFAIMRTADRRFREEIGDFEMFLQTEYQQWLHQPLLKDHIMMSSFWGRNNQFNDNPEALYRYCVEHYPEMTTIIVLKDAIRSYPEYPNAKVISYGTKEYWYYLARSKYFVNNVNFTEPQRIKRVDQVEVQTMHGTPLKTLGFEVLDDWKDATYNEMLRKNSNWDYLTVPSDWVAEYALEAFRVSPQIIKSGYSRNDKLFVHYTDDEKNNLKIRMGLPTNKKIVAYTPTWRGKTETTIDKFLNIDDFYKKIPNDTVIAIKNHHYEPWKKINDKYKDKIIILELDTEIEDLYHVSDALITDYSSVMFDYCLLNKPMIFWTFDYDRYVESRGINLNLKNEAPGPIVFKQAELSKWVKNFDKIPEEYSEKIRTFRNKFGQYDKGNASEIILRRLFND